MILSSAFSLDAWILPIEQLPRWGNRSWTSTRRLSKVALGLALHPETQRQPTNRSWADYIDQHSRKLVLSALSYPLFGATKDSPNRASLSERGRA